MELVYHNKKKKEEILLESEKLGRKLELTKSNLLFHGDNFEGLSLLIKNGFKGKVDLVYIDPPFATNNDFKYSDYRVSTISTPKDGELAYSDKLEEGEYLEFLRERLFLLRELLSEKGSMYLHIDYKIGHYVKLIMDEVFGRENFLNDISRVKGNPKNFKRASYGNQKDMVLFYAKNRGRQIFNDITVPLSDKEIEKNFQKIDSDGRRYNTVPIHAPGESSGDTGGVFMGILPPEGRHWRTSPEILEEQNRKGLIEWSNTGNPRLKKFADEHKGKKIQDIWLDFKDSPYPEYPTQKNKDMLEMIILQSSNEGSIVLDAFCGSGSTLEVAKKNNRGYIGIDESDKAIKITKSKIDNFQFIELKKDKPEM